MSFNLAILTPHLPQLFRGLLSTIVLFVLVMLFSTLLSLPLALARLSRVTLISSAAAWYVNGVRMVPVLVVLFFTFYGLPRLGIQVLPFTAALVGLVIGTVANMAEDFRAALLAVDPRQIEAANALGLGYLRRTWRVVLPQSLPVLVAPYFNRAMLVLLATSLASLVAVGELTGQSMALISSTYRATEFLSFAVVCYLLLSAVLASLQRLAQRLVRIP